MSENILVKGNFHCTDPAWIKWFDEAAEHNTKQIPELLEWYKIQLLKDKKSE